ncbi:hypothetical protein ACHAPT_012721 [Fusarium lateritium]
MPRRNIKRSASAVAWLRENNPWKPPEPGMPFLPEERPRPLTASSECQGSKDSQLFTKLPQEIRLDILRQAFGDNDIHIELDYGYPPMLEKRPRSRRYGSRISVRYCETWCNRTGDPWGQHRLVPNKWKPKKWRWWSRVCYRGILTPFWGLSTHSSVKLEPWWDRCKFDLGPIYEPELGSDSSKRHVGVMGWLLSCRQAYREGTQVLYSTNGFLLSNTELILDLPKFLLPSRLESMTRVEMHWRIHPFREQLELDPPLSDPDAFLTLAKQTPVIFPNLKMLYVSLLGDLYAAEGDTTHQNFATEHVYSRVEQVVMKPIEDMLRNFSHLTTCVIAIPASCYCAEKQHALAHGGRVLDERFDSKERIWRELPGASALDGYWLQIGHRDMGEPSMTDGFGAPPRVREVMEVLYTEYGFSPWGDRGGRLPIQYQDLG